MGNGRRLAAIALLIIVALTAVTACSSADDALRVLGKQVGKVDEVAERLPAGRLPGPVNTSRDAIEQQINRMMTRLSGTDEKTAKQVSNAACIAADALKIKSLEDAVKFGIQQTNTPPGWETTVASLAQELQQAESSGDQAQILAQAAICQWAGA